MATRKLKATMYCDRCEKIVDADSRCPKAEPIIEEVKVEKYREIAKYFSYMFGCSVEWEQFDENEGTIIISEDLSLKVIGKIMDLERKFNVKVKDIRIKEGALCVDLKGV